MKKSALPIAAIALIAATTSCSHDEELTVNFDQPVEIRPAASIYASMLTRADETRSFDDSYAVTAFKKAAGAETENTHFVNTMCTGGVFTPQKYFPSDGTALNFYAYAPVATAAYSEDTHKVEWTLDGEKDIVWATGTGAKNANGGGAAQPEFTFSHKLTKLNIEVKAETGFEAIDISSMNILDVKTGATLNLREGTMAYAGEADLPVKYTGTSKEIGATAATYGYIMLPAGPDFKSYKVSVKTGSGATEIQYPDVELKFENSSDYFVAGNEYTVTLTFKGTEISSGNAQITQWTSGGGVSSDVK